MPELITADEVVGLDHGLVGHFGHGLKRGGVQFAGHDGSDGVVGAVEADYDDVVTTGSTCNELAKCLIEAGAEKVGVLAVARAA